MTTRIRNPKSKRVRLTIELPTPEAKRVKELAHSRGVSVGRVIQGLAYQAMALR